MHPGVGPTLADHERRIAELEGLVTLLQDAVFELGVALRRANESHAHAMESAT